MESVNKTSLGPCGTPVARIEVSVKSTKRLEDWQLEGRFSSREEGLELLPLAKEELEKERGKREAPSF